MNWGLQPPSLIFTAVRISLFYQKQSKLFPSSSYYPPARISTEAMKEAKTSILWNRKIYFWLQKKKDFKTVTANQNIPNTNLQSSCLLTSMRIVFSCSGSQSYAFISRDCEKLNATILEQGTQDANHTILRITLIEQNGTYF